jgi:hypothetical protein
VIGVERTTRVVKQAATLPDGLTVAAAANKPMASFEVEHGSWEPESESGQCSPGNGLSLSKIWTCLFAMLLKQSQVLGIRSSRNIGG